MFHRVFAILMSIFVAFTVMSQPANAAKRPAPKPIAKVNALGSTTPYRIMALGDSITQGVGDPAGNGYRGPLRATAGVQSLNPDFVGMCPRPTFDAWKCWVKPTMTDPQNSGFSGWRTDEIALRLPYLMDWYDPQTVLLMAGANDVGQNYDLDNYANRMGAMIDTILSKRPGTHVFVATMTQFADQRPIVGTLNAQLITMVKSKDQNFVHLVPMHIVGDEPAIELSDHVHPNGCGYKRMAYVWWYYMKAVPALNPATDWGSIPNPFYTAC